MQQQPGNSLANYFYAMALWKGHSQPADSGGLPQVEALLTKAIAMDDKCADAYLQLGVIYASQHSFEKAIAAYLKAIEANPELADAYYRLGVAYDRTGEAEKAKREFQLHDALRKKQAAAVEAQRREVKQFLVVAPGQADHPPAH
jgi:tetratricopeptide (TPR) repeat protein